MHNVHFGGKHLKRLDGLKSERHDILSEIKRHIPKKKYKLTQSSFRNGTVRITKPGKYVLAEDITFSPNASNDFRPLPTQTKYSNRAYSLGFFAAITIEVDGVEIDLNGKTLKQGDKMAWMQRFYANIETASTPFIPGQGPGDFGKNIRSPKYIYIHGGTLGRSSHHGIHGNGNEYVVVEDVKMIDYEFVGSAINGGKYIVHHNCKILRNFKDLKVLATWSAALFAQQFTDDIAHKLAENTSVDRVLFNNFNQNRLRLRSSIHQTKNELFANKRTVSNPLYRNDKLLADGNVYGILSNPLGVAINDFSSEETMKDKKHASHFIIENCEIRDLEGDVDEVISFVNAAGKAQKGPSGDLLKLDDCMTDDGRYRGNEISDMIFALARVKKVYPSLGYGTLNIDDDVLRWSQGELSFFQLKNRGYKFITGQDSMGHVGKGVLGIRIDGTKHVVLSHNNVKNVINHARLGAEHNKSTDKTYQGTITAGIHLAYSQDVWIDKTLVKDIKSYNGEASGVKAINNTKANIYHSSIDGITSGLKYDEGEWTGRTHSKTSQVYHSTAPNEFPSAKGVCWTYNSKVSFENVDIKTLKGPQVFYIAIVG